MAWLFINLFDMMNISFILMSHLRVPHYETKKMNSAYLTKYILANVLNFTVCSCNPFYFVGWWLLISIETFTAVVKEPWWFLQFLVESPLTDITLGRQIPLNKPTWPFSFAKKKLTMQTWFQQSIFSNQFPATIFQK